MKRTKARVLIAALIAALLLPGCSLFKPTPVSLVNAALTNIKKSIDYIREM
jgi:PBP1b-binding outer membrane lipoprotein LpoB